MAKNKNDYFKLIESQLACCVEASNYLEEILCNYSFDRIPEQRDKMHNIEHEADKIHHDILSRLSVEFITPIDQEDILRLVQILDDVTDAIDEVVMDFYMFNVIKLPQYAPEMSRIVNRCVKALYEASKELKNFKKPEALHKQLVIVNDIETEGDDVFMEAIHNLFVNCEHGKEILCSKEIYESLENCLDLCEHAADIIEQVIIKNT